MHSPRDITDLIKNPAPGELELVGKAFTFAAEAHKDHKRYSGEPYFNHLFETAKMLAELGMDGAAIAAGFLHDSIEEGGVTPETLEREFGAEVLMLVEGVTKLGHFRYRGIDRYSESLRRLFIASARDIRVLIIKLADRLHNVLTLEFVPTHKRERIAKETLEIYAPIAYRLGIRRINRELEEGAFPFAYPAEYSRVRALLHVKGRELVKKLEKFNKALHKQLARQGVSFIETHRRIKGLYSLYVKLKNKDWDVAKIHDMLAIRVIVGSVEDCYRALGAVHASWRPLPGRIKDYIAFPKPNGYQSLHTTVFTGDGGVVEMQIRTAEMHRECEFGVAAQFAYKEQERRAPVRETSWAKRMLAALVSWRAKSTHEDETDAATLAAAGAVAAAKPERGEAKGGVPSWVRELGRFAKEEQTFWEHLNDDFFKNRVFVFTPLGDVVDLPSDSNPIDFAYAIHSDIGDHLTGAKVNDKMVSLETALKNGDIVEVLTKPAAHPSRKWLSLAHTSVAKKHIRNALQRLGL